MDLFVVQKLKEHLFVAYSATSEPQVTVAFLILIWIKIILQNEPHAVLLNTLGSGNQNKKYGNVSQENVRITGYS